MSEGILINPNLMVYFATITVTYPSGSTLTCSNGSYVLTAETTSGSYTFVVPYAATWTVKATQGSNTASTNVSVTTYNQAAKATLSYRTYIIKEGSIPTAISSAATATTAGWYKYNGSWTITKDSVFIDDGEAHGRGCLTPAVNLTNVSKLNFEVSAYNRTYPNYATDDASNWWLARIGLLSSWVVYDMPSYAAVVVFPSEMTTTRKTLTIDTSKLSGNYLICPRASLTHEMTIHNIWY